MTTAATAPSRTLVVSPTLPRVGLAERLAVLAVLLVFLALGANHIRHGAFAGQDFSFHVGCTNRLLGQPGEWFTQDVTNRPLIYWIAIDGIFVTDNRAAYEFAAGVFILCNAVALWLLHDASRRLIASPAVRVAAVAFVALLPAALIASVVFAADAMAMPPFVLLGWSLLRWREASNNAAAAKFAALAALGLIVGNFTKATFLVLPLGVAFVLALAWRHRLATSGRVVLLFALGIVIPSLVGLSLHRAAQHALRDAPAHHHFDWRGTGELTWRSLLTVKPSDARIFDAPGYWDTTIVDGQRTLPLLINNSYSYPALLHLGLYTDVLDFSRGGVRQTNQPRPEPQKTYSRLAVCTGVAFSLVALVALILLSVRFVRDVARPSATLSFAVSVWFVLALNWAAPLVLTLPFVAHAYDWGYWTPRLIIPAVWAFSLCVFSVVDSASTTRPWLARTVLAATLAQSALHVLSVWF